MRPTHCRKGDIRLVLLIDTYETFHWDTWMCETFAQSLPPDIKVIMLGRNRLSRDNPDWNQFGREDIYYHELQELSEDEAKAYLYHHGLRDDTSLERVYRFTGGYPLCLVLAVDCYGNELGRSERF